MEGAGGEKSPNDNRPYNGQLLNFHTFLKLLLVNMKMTLVMVILITEKEKHLNLAEYQKTKILQPHNSSKLQTHEGFFLGGFARNSTISAQFLPSLPSTW